MQSESIGRIPERFLLERLISVTELMELQVIPWKLQMELLAFHELKKSLVFEFSREVLRFSRISSSFDLVIVSNENTRRRREKTREENMLEGSEEKKKFDIWVLQV